MNTAQLFIKEGRTTGTMIFMIDYEKSQLAEYYTRYGLIFVKEQMTIHKIYGGRSCSCMCGRKTSKRIHLNLWAAGVTSRARL